MTVLPVRIETPGLQNVVLFLLTISLRLRVPVVLNRTRAVLLYLRLALTSPLGLCADNLRQKLASLQLPSRLSMNASRSLSLVGTRLWA